MNDDSKTNVEHVSMFLAQMAEASTMEVMNVCYFPLSLTNTMFARFTSLPTCSIGSWVEFEEIFHEHLYIGVHKARLSNLTSSHQGCDEHTFDFVKYFRDIKN
jgi:hypothetical protein